MYMPNRKGKNKKTNTNGNVYTKQKGEKNKKQIRTEMYMPNRRGKKQKTNTDGNVYAKQKGKKQKPNTDGDVYAIQKGKNKKQIRTEMYAKQKKNI